MVSGTADEGTVHMRLIRNRRTRLAAIATSMLILLTAAGCSASGSSSGVTAPQQRPGPARGTPMPDQGMGPEVDAEREPRSTFAIDIDTASYNYARRQILDGRAPDPTTIRPEE